MLLIVAKDLFCVRAHLHLCLELILNCGLSLGLQVFDVGSEENKKCCFLLSCPVFFSVRGTVFSLWHLQYFTSPEQTRLLKSCTEFIMRSPCGSSLLCRETWAKLCLTLFMKSQSLVTLCIFNVSQVLNGSKCVWKSLEESKTSSSDPWKHSPIWKLNPPTKNSAWKYPFP